MKTPKERDQVLHTLYQNRKFLVFMFGEESFDSQAMKIHWEWEQSGTWLKVSEQDVFISKISWEADNGYLDQETA